MDDIVAKISDMLRRIQEKGGQGNLVIFIANAEKNYYIQIIGNKDDPTLFAEAVSNSFLETKHRLDSRQLELLGKLGWSPPGTTPNFHREWRARVKQDRLVIADEIIKTFIEVYDWKLEQGIESEISLK
jgi:hypothetical protein